MSFKNWKKKSQSVPLIYFLFSYIACVVGQNILVHTNQSQPEEVRRQLSGVGFLLPRVLELRSLGLHTAPLPTEPPCWPQSPSLEEEKPGHGGLHL